MLKACATDAVASGVNERISELLLFLIFNEFVSFSMTENMLVAFVMHGCFGMTKGILTNLIMVDPCF